MLKTYTAKYTRISSGYMGQLVEWPEVITEGKSLDDCRELIQDALREMIVAYRQQDKEIPLGGGLIEQISVEIYTNGERTIPIERHRILERITANQLCKQAGLEPKF